MILNYFTILTFHRKNCPQSIAESGIEIGVEEVLASFFQKSRGDLFTFSERSQKRYTSFHYRENFLIFLVFVTPAFVPLVILQQSPWNEREKPCACPQKGEDRVEDGRELGALLGQAGLGRPTLRGVVVVSLRSLSKHPILSGDYQCWRHHPLYCCTCPAGTEPALRAETAPPVGWQPVRIYLSP